MLSDKPLATTDAYNSFTPFDKMLRIQPVELPTASGIASPSTRLSLVQHTLKPPVQPRDSFKMPWEEKGAGNERWDGYGFALFSQGSSCQRCCGSSSSLRPRECEAVYADRARLSVDSQNHCAVCQWAGHNLNARIAKLRVLPLSQMKWSQVGATLHPSYNETALGQTDQGSTLMCNSLPIMEEAPQHVISAVATFPVNDTWKESSVSREQLVGLSKKSFSPISKSDKSTQPFEFVADHKHIVLGTRAGDILYCSYSAAPLHSGAVSQGCCEEKKKKQAVATLDPKETQSSLEAHTGSISHSEFQDDRVLPFLSILARASIQPQLDIIGQERFKNNLSDETSAEPFNGSAITMLSVLPVPFSGELLFDSFILAGASSGVIGVWGVQDKRLKSDSVPRLCCLTILDLRSSPSTPQTKNPLTDTQHSSIPITPSLPKAQPVLSDQGPKANATAPATDPQETRQRDATSGYEELVSGTVTPTCNASKSLPDAQTPYGAAGANGPQELPTQSNDETLSMSNNGALQSIVQSSNLSEGAAVTQFLAANTSTLSTSLSVFPAVTAGTLLYSTVREGSIVELVALVGWSNGDVYQLRFLISPAGDANLCPSARSTTFSGVKVAWNRRRLWPADSGLGMPHHICTVRLPTPDDPSSHSKSPSKHAPLLAGVTCANGVVILQVSPVFQLILRELISSFPSSTSASSKTEEIVATHCGIGLITLKPTSGQSRMPHTTPKSVVLTNLPLLVSTLQFSQPIVLRYIYQNQKYTWQVIKGPLLMLPSKTLLSNPSNCLTIDNTTIVVARPGTDSELEVVLLPPAAFLPAEKSMEPLLCQTAILCGSKPSTNLQSSQASGNYFRNSHITRPSILGLFENSMIRGSLDPTTVYFIRDDQRVIIFQCFPSEALFQAWNFRAEPERTTVVSMWEDDVRLKQPAVCNVDTSRPNQPTFTSCLSVDAVDLLVYLSQDDEKDLAGPPHRRLLGFCDNLLVAWLLLKEDLSIAKLYELATRTDKRWCESLFNIIQTAALTCRVDEQHHSFGLESFLGEGSRLLKPHKPLTVTDDEEDLFSKMLQLFQEVLFCALAALTLIRVSEILMKALSPSQWIQRVPDSFPKLFSYISQSPSLFGWFEKKRLAAFAPLLHVFHNIWHMSVTTALHAASSQPHALTLSKTTVIPTSIASASCSDRNNASFFDQRFLPNAENISLSPSRFLNIQRSFSFNTTFSANIEQDRHVLSPTSKTRCHSHPHSSNSLLSADEQQMKRVASLPCLLSAPPPVIHKELELKPSHIFPSLIGALRKGALQITESASPCPELKLRNSSTSQVTISPSASTSQVSVSTEGLPTGKNIQLLSPLNFKRSSRQTDPLQSAPTHVADTHSTSHSPPTFLYTTSVIVWKAILLILSARLAPSSTDFKRIIQQVLMQEGVAQFLPNLAPFMLYAIREHSEHSLVLCECLLDLFPRLLKLDIMSYALPVFTSILNAQRRSPSESPLYSLDLATPLQQLHQACTAQANMDVELLLLESIALQGCVGSTNSVHDNRVYFDADIWTIRITTAYCNSSLARDSWLDDSVFSQVGINCNKKLLQLFENHSASVWSEPAVRPKATTDISTPALKTSTPTANFENQSFPLSYSVPAILRFPQLILSLCAAENRLLDGLEAMRSALSDAVLEQLPILPSCRLHWAEHVLKPALTVLSSAYSKPPAPFQLAPEYVTDSAVQLLISFHDAFSLSILSESSGSLLAINDKQNLHFWKLLTQAYLTERLPFDQRLSTFQNSAHALQLRLRRRFSEATHPPQIASIFLRDANTALEAYDRLVSIHWKISRGAVTQTFQNLLAKKCNGVAKRLSVAFNVNTSKYAPTEKFDTLLGVLFRDTAERAQKNVPITISSEPQPLQSPEAHDVNPQPQSNLDHQAPVTNYFASNASLNKLHLPFGLHHWETQCLATTRAISKSNDVMLDTHMEVLSAGS